MARELRQIKWGSAEVEDGALTVELDGTASKAWKARFENVLALLDSPHSGWGEVRLTKRAIEVADVQEGSEDELRHFLESAVLQANADIAPDALQREDDDEQDREPDVDERMTQTFRGFAAERQHSNS